MTTHNLGIFVLIRQYINEHLIGFRRCSDHTLRGNKTLLRMFVRFLSCKCNVKLEALTIEHLTADNVISFINWLIDEKGNSEASANLRLALIKSFCSFVISKEPIYADKLMEIKQIKKLKESVSPVDFLSEENMLKFIALPDIGTKKGIRDRLLIIVMYETGARLAEVAKLRYLDFIKTGKAFSCRLFGKGRKERIVPVSDKVFQHVEHYKNMVSASDDGYIFTASCRPASPLSSSALYKIITKYGNELSKVTNGAVPNVHPHMLRHTMAMHLYRNGVALDLVSQLLGHSSVETTTIYAFADTEMKRKAIETSIEHRIPSLPENKDFWSDEEKLLKLASLM